MANVKAKKRVSNAIMTVAAVIIVVAGVLFALNLRDGSSPSAPAATGSGSSAPVAVTTLDKVGNVNIERSGLGYALENDATLQDGDIVETLKGSRISVARNAATTLSFGEKTEAGRFRCGLDRQPYPGHSGGNCQRKNGSCCGNCGR